jgi:hypothetical protein
MCGLIVKHPIFRDKPGDASTLWRYMPISALMQLLTMRTLHFTRIDKFDDKFEGVWPQEDQKYLDTIEGLDSRGYHIPSFTKEYRTKVAASCWHESEYESAAMWDRYAFGNQGISIKTTFGKLKAVLGISETINDKNRLYHLFDAGRVQYFDHVNDGLRKLGNRDLTLLSPFMLKHKGYEYEHEVRVLIETHFGYEISAEGLSIPIDIEHLINEIVLNPHVENWFRDTVTAVVQKFGIKVDVKPSILIGPSWPT